MRTIALLLLTALTQLFFPTPTSSQTRNVTFIVNTCTVPDTVGPNYNIQLRGNKPPLTWGNDTGGRMTNIGGDYWSKTLAFTVGDTILFKIFAGSDAWESDIDNVLGFVNNRAYIVANRDTTLPVQFFSSFRNGVAQYSPPWTTVVDTFMNVYFRVNMLVPIRNAFLGFDNDRDTVGIRGGGPSGGDLNWAPTFYLKKETPPADGGTFSVPAYSFWSGRVRIPKSDINVGQAIQYKFLIGFDWGRDELQGQSNRSFRVPTGKKDTTISFAYFNNMRPTTDPPESIRITYTLNMQRAISNGEFNHGDSLLVRSGYHRTAVRLTQKNFIRQGVSTVYAATDTVMSRTSHRLFYQYYMRKSGADVREYYYDYFWNRSDDDSIVQAMRRPLFLNSSSIVVRDSVSSSRLSPKRFPVFPNLRTLNRRVSLRWEVDLRPAYYQIRFGGDTLFDRSGATHISNADSVFRLGVWINGPAAGGWKAWGTTLREDTTRKMFDNGTNGDRTAGDSIYTRIILVAPESLGVGSKGQIAQYARFSIGGGDNEVGKKWVGADHFENISDVSGTYTLNREWGIIDPRFYSQWDYDRSGPIILDVIPINTMRSAFLLAQNFPNPFNPTTQIEYSLPQESIVSLRVFNLLGQEVATLVNEVQDSGLKSVEFDSRSLSSGVYLYRLTAGEFTSVKKMIVIR